MKCIYCGNHMRLQSLRTAQGPMEFYFECRCGSKTPVSDSEEYLIRLLDDVLLRQDGLKYRAWEAGYEAGKAAK